jgi:aspartate/methionine/tyrosine aminotransferase
MAVQLPQGSLISFMANKVKLNGGINMAQGIPAYSPPVELLNCLSECTYQNQHQYAPGIGNNALRTAILQQYAKYKFEPDNLLVVNGATEGLSTIFTYLFKKLNQPFTTLSFTPVYEVYRHLPRMFNMPFVAFNLLANGGFNADELKRTILAHKVKVIFVASPGNPLGFIWGQNQWEQLCALVEELNCYLVVDAVYSELYYQAQPYYPLKKISENVFYVNAFSKRYSITGWRIGYIISDFNSMQGLRDVHDYIGLSGPSVLQQALANFLKVPYVGSVYCQQLRTKLKNNYNTLCLGLQKLGFEVSEAHGGYFVWARLPQGFTSGYQMAVNLYNQHQLAIVPGIHFVPESDHYVRLNIAVEPEILPVALEKLARFINENRVD